MARPKKGTKAGDLATAKWRATMLAKYGSEEAFHKAMQRMGEKGGKASNTGGFAANPQLAKVAGAKGGKSHRGRGPAKRDAQGRALRKDGTPYRSWPTGKDRAPRKANTKRATKDLDELIAEIEKEEKPTLTYEETKTQRRNLFLRFFRRKK